MSRFTSAIAAIAVGIAFTIIPNAIARAQLGGLGEAAKRGATEAVKKDIAEKAGLGTPVATGLASPTTAASPATASPASTPSPVTVEGATKSLMDQAGKRAVDEAGKKMVPKLP